MSTNLVRPPLEPPHSVLQAITSPRFLLTAWPWRSALHAMTTAMVAIVFAPPLLLITFPLYLPLLMRVSESPGIALSGIPLLALLVAGSVLVTVCGPPLALPFAALERARLRIVDSRPVVSGHRTPETPGLGAWALTRFREPATWSELAYLVLTVAVGLPVVGVLASGALVVGTLAVLPLLAAQNEGPIALGGFSVVTPVQAAPFSAGGIAGLAVLLYALSLAAGAHGALARFLLTDRGGGMEDELTEVTRSRARLVDAFEAERRRIERDLHDGAQQRLVALSMQLGLARIDLPPDGPAAISVAEAQEHAKRATAELRELIRGIHPQVLSGRGLPAALPELADHCPVSVEVTAELDRRLPGHIEGTAYFVVSEALANVAKHSGAERASVAARLHGDLLVVSVTDDGAGGADPAGGTGLTGLADRIAVMDGRMLLSSPPGGPTVVKVELPCL